MLLLSTTTSVFAEPNLNFDKALRDHILSLPLIQGTPLTPIVIKDHAIVITFFASWCPPCREEFKYLSALRTEYSQEQLIIIAINVFEDYFEGSDERLSQFLETTSPKFHVVKGNQKTRTLFDNVERIPTLFVFDSEGNTVEHFIHKRGAKKRTAELNELRGAVTDALSR
jgi:cytochrome c biogenesis protein CcmG/thiol:disulfide interchange protein DsbE